MAAALAAGAAGTAAVASQQARCLDLLGGRPVQPPPGQGQQHCRSGLPAAAVVPVAAAVITLVRGPGGTLGGAARTRGPACEAGCAWLPMRARVMHARIAPPPPPVPQHDTLRAITAAMKDLHPTFKLLLQVAELAARCEQVRKSTWGGGRPLGLALAAVASSLGPALRTILLGCCRPACRTAQR